MNEKIIEAAGFQEEIDNVKQNKCPFCKEPVPAEVLGNMSLADRKEFEISGLCLTCQKEMFG